MDGIGIGWVRFEMTDLPLRNALVWYEWMMNQDDCLVDGLKVWIRITRLD